MTDSRKVALVTGGASGLGEAIARRLSADGAAVVIADIDTQNAETMASELGNEAMALQLDVSQERDWVSGIATIEERFGRLDILVNNAGITTMGNVEDISYDDFVHEFNIDVFGVFLGCKYGIGLMKKIGGSIINMSSAAGIRASADLVAYNAAKSAIIGFTKSVALHCAQQQYDIRCNSVHPGAIHTPIIDKVLAQTENPEEVMAGFVAAHPVGHLGKPAEIAAMVAYLASDESTFATGAQFVVDGGMTL